MKEGASPALPERKPSARSWNPILSWLPSERGPSHNRTETSGVREPPVASQRIYLALQLARGSAREEDETRRSNRSSASGMRGALSQHISTPVAFRVQM